MYIFITYRSVLLSSPLGRNSHKPCNNLSSSALDSSHIPAYWPSIRRICLPPHFHTSEVGGMLKAYGTMENIDESINQSIFIHTQFIKHYNSTATKTIQTEINNSKV